MKLYLSSYRIPVPQALFELVGKAPADTKLVIIPNARDYKLPEERALSLDELTADLERLGFSVDITDLRDYEDTQLLQERLSGYDVIYVAGGNTFMLRAEMQRSGLDQCIYPLLENGMVYCGESAGAIVAGSTLEGSEIADDPEIADEIVNDGLKLTDHILVPHADSIEFVEYANAMRKRHADDPRVVYIDDNQAFVVSGDEVKIVTAD